MKKTLLIAALSMAAAPAFASKARLNALGNADHLHDVQRTFDRPYEAAMFGEYATVEFGTASPSYNGNPTAEGGFVRQWGDNNYLGLYVGHQPDVLTNASTGVFGLAATPYVRAVGAAASAARTATATALQTAGYITDIDRDAWFSTLRNPVNLWWAAKVGDITWGVNAFYESASQNSTATINSTNVGGATAGDPVAGISNRHATVGGISLGAAGSSWDADATIGLTGKSEYSIADTTRSLKANSNYQLHGAYRMDTWDIYGRYGSTSATATLGGNDGLKTDANAYAVGIIDSRKKDGVEFFYGAEINGATAKLGVPGGSSWKFEDMSVPLIVGVEADATSWMVLRGSVRQIIWGNRKATIPGTNGDTVNNDTLSDTVVGAGTGFKFGKFNLDTYLAAAQSGTISLASDGTGAAPTTGDKFLTQASLTYTF